MSDIKKTFRELRHYPIAIAFFGVLALFIVLNLATPDKASSELENRLLKQRPQFNTSVLAGSWAPDQWGSKLSAFATEASRFTTAYNDYAQDQVVDRDGWVSAYGLAEQLLGKLEINGVWFARNNYQISQDSNMVPDADKFDRNVEAVEELARRHPGQVNVMIVPSPANALSSYLSYHPPQIDENVYMDQMLASFEAAGAGVIDLRATYAAHVDEPLYYRTDHHWTTRGGAWLAYLDYCQMVGIQPKEPTAPLVEVEDFYGTNYARTRRWGTVPDTLAFYDLPNAMTVYNYDTQTAQVVQDTHSVMNYAKLEEYDKYAAFLWGNNGYSVIEGNGEGSVLVIKDSYGNSFVPYLVENYAQVGIIDLRAWGQDRATSLDSAFLQGEYDSMLVLYSYATFLTDGSIVKMSDARQF